MGKPTEPYNLVWVESYIAEKTSGLHGKVHIRPTVDSGYPTHLRVRCSHALKRDYPVGTKFHLKVKLTDKEGGEEFLHSLHTWAPVAIVRPEGA